MRKKKIKILHVAQAAGGVDRYIRMLLKYLDKEKFENILVCSQDFNREDYDGLVDSFEQIEMNRAIGVSDLNSIKEVRRLIKKYNPDIVYAHSSKAGAIARVADIGLKNHCVYIFVLILNNEYIVDYVVNVRDAERFAKLVKSNSVMGFAKFISLALDDWPESDVFQKIAITPPDEELNDSEYYLGLMSRISAIKDIAAVEDVLLEREPIFQRYELELWRRIAIVLTDRGDIRRLYNSGLKYIRFLKEISEKVTIRDEAVDAIEAYCVGLHNAEAVDEYGAFLKKCGELTQLLADNKRIAVICCQNYGRLMHLRLYKNVNAEIQEEWNAIVEILKQCNYDEDVYKNVLDAVEEYFRTLVQRKKEDKLFELERFMAQVYEENGRCEAAEVAALCLANLYNSGGHRKITPDEYETIKKYLQKFPESMHIRAAFIIASEAIYSPSAEYKRVPDKIINKAKQWSEQYPKKIEFQEAYFGLLFSRLKYAQAQDMRNEQRRVYREMKTVAERANYSEYNESNQLMESVDILHRVFGY